MPILFNVPTNITAAKVMQLINKPPQAASKETCRIIYAGECEFLTSNSTERFIYSGETTTCLQICLYGINQEGVKELCVIHWNNSFQLNWESIVAQFTSTEISMKIIGACDASSMASYNLQQLQDSFTKYKKITVEHKDDIPKKITLLQQCVAHHNKNFSHARHLLWDMSGECYDAKTLRAQLKTAPNHPARIAREKEAELREWISRDYLKLPIEKPIIQLNANTQTFFSPSYFSVKVIEDILTKKRLKNYLESAGLGIHFSTTSPDAKEHMRDHMHLVDACKLAQKHQLPYMFHAEQAMTCLAPLQYKLVQVDMLRQRFACALEKSEKGLNIFIHDNNQNMLFGFTIENKFSEGLDAISSMVGGDGNERILKIKEDNVFIHYDYVKQVLAYHGIVVDNNVTSHILAATRFSEIMLEKLTSRSQMMKFLLI